ncbi:unnamed protein product [Alternaria alternata]
MRTSITSLLLSLAVASSAQEEVPGLNQPKDTECELISPVVDGLLAVPSATEFCSSLLSIPTVTVTSLAVSTLTLTSIVETLETTTLLATFTNTDETSVTGTTTLTADAVTVTDTTTTTVDSCRPKVGTVIVTVTAEPPVKRDYAHTLSSSSTSCTASKKSTSTHGGIPIIRSVERGSSFVLRISNNFFLRILDNFSDALVRLLESSGVSVPNIFERRGSVFHSSFERRGVIFHSKFKHCRRSIFNDFKCCGNVVHLVFGHYRAIYNRTVKCYGVIFNTRTYPDPNTLPIRSLRSPTIRVRTSIRSLLLPLSRNPHRHRSGQQHRYGGQRVHNHYHH